MKDETVGRAKKSLVASKTIVDEKITTNKLI